MLSGEITDRDLADSSAHAAAGPRSAEAEVLDTWPDSEIRSAMQSLSEGSRMVIYYADVEGYTYAQTAALMGIPIGTVMSRVSRARKQLRVSLAEFAPASDDVAA
jgi:RNA polymerase sigma-70 factor (ECF subfamily)